jgi:hypothetical protein
MIRVLLQQRHGNIDDRILELSEEQYNFLLFLQDNEVIDDCEFVFINLDELEEVSFEKE